MIRLMIALMLLVGVTSAQKIDVNFGTVGCDTLDAVVSNLEWAGIEQGWFDYVFVDSAAEFNGMINLDAFRDTASATNYALTVDASNYFGGDSLCSSYGLYVHGSRPALDSMMFVSGDYLIDASYTNSAHNDLTTSEAIGLNLLVRNTLGASVHDLIGSYIYATGLESSTADTMVGQKIYVTNNGHIEDLLAGLMIFICNEDTAATSEYGLYIRNTNDSLATAVNAAIAVTDGGANIGWTYGIDFDGATIQGAEIVGMNGETLDNRTEGYWNTSGASVVSAGYNFATAAMVGGTGDATTIDFVPDLPALTAGLCVTYVAEAANTGAMTMTIDTGAAKAVFKAPGGIGAVAANDIRIGQVVTLVYDGTQWQMTSQLGN